MATTFMASPLACSVATKSLEIIDRGDWEVQVDGINTQLQSVRKAASLPVVKDVRGLGAIGVVQLNNKVDMAWFQKRFVDRGVWIRPFGSLVYIMPPYRISREDLEKLIDSLIDVVKSWNNFTNI
jgi:adenosylmethionine-8-amino-7-oxononanoate aminotransferase